MVEANTLQDRCDRRSFSPVWLQILNLPTWSHRGINVMNKLSMCQFVPKIVLETKHAPLSWRGPAVFKRSNFQYGGNTRIGDAPGKGSSYHTKQTRP